ncbi:MAG: histidine kinase [Peptococcaceae bacterium]|nr:histidine kinase [Peptococcaceae bacterium]
MSKALVSELLKKLDREIRTKRILSELHNYGNLKETMTTVIKHFMEITDCEAIGIRLNNGQDFPYYAYEGLPPAYIVKEPALCSMNPGERRFTFEDDQVWTTKCLCSDVIKGRIEKDLPCFTSQGSFWTNNSPYAYCQREQDCFYSGFKSLAFIRIIANNECIGLIHLFSNRTKFSLDMILYLEMIGTYIGTAVSNCIKYAQMKEAFDSLNMIPICSHCKKVNVEGEQWKSIENFLFQQTGAEFTHTICPDCMDHLYPEISARIKQKYMAQ